MDSRGDNATNEIARMHVETISGRTIEIVANSTDAHRRALLAKLVAELTTTPHADIKLIAHSAYDAKCMLKLFLDPATPHDLRTRIVAFNSLQSVRFDFGNGDVRKLYVFPRTLTPMPGIVSSMTFVAE